MDAQNIKSGLYFDNETLLDIDYVLCSYEVFGSSFESRDILIFLYLYFVMLFHFCLNIYSGAPL